MDEDKLYEYIDFIRELIYGKEAQKFSYKLNNDDITNVETTEKKLDKFNNDVENIHSRIYDNKRGLYNVLFFINQDFIIPYDKAAGFIQKELNNKGKYSKKTLELYSPLLDEATYNEVYKFSLSGTSMDKNINIINDIMNSNVITEEITSKDLEFFGLILRYKIYYLVKFDYANSNLKYIFSSNPDLFNFNEQETLYIYVIYNKYFDAYGKLDKNIINMIKLENTDLFISSETNAVKTILQNIKLITTYNLKVKDDVIDTVVKTINKNILKTTNVPSFKKLKILNEIINSNNITEDISIQELEYFGLVLKYKVYYLNRINAANNNLKYLYESNPNLFKFNIDEIKVIYDIYKNIFKRYGSKNDNLIGILELENLNMFHKDDAYKLVLNNLNLLDTYKIVINTDIIKDVVKNKYNDYVEVLKNTKRSEFEHDFEFEEYINMTVENISKVLNIIGILDMWDILSEIDFLTYQTLKDKYPSIKKYKNKISKESIIKFLQRSEVSQDDIDDWNEVYKSQYGENAEPPPPPDWWLLSRSSDVHTKKTVNLTDCRIKLLIKNYSYKDIVKVAEDIEHETSRLAYKVGKEDNIKNLNEYVKNNTVTKEQILMCRLDESTPKYYGYGGVYEQQKAKELADRVEICNIVTSIWEVIKSTKGSEMYDTLLVQFVGAFKEHISGGVCNQGWVGGLTSIFGGYSKELGYLCMSEKEEDINALVSNFLIDMKQDVSVPYPTVNKLFVEISNILLDAKYEDDWDYNSHTKEENDSFDEKVKMYDILFENDSSASLKTQTMKKYVDCMLPTFFMQAVDYFEKKETLVKIKEASKAAIEEFKQFQVDKICGTKSKN